MEKQPKQIYAIQGESIDQVPAIKIYYLAGKAGRLLPPGSAREQVRFQILNLSGRIKKEFVEELSHRLKYQCHLNDNQIQEFLTQNL